MTAQALLSKEDLEGLSVAVDAALDGRANPPLMVVTLGLHDAEIKVLRTALRIAVAEIVKHNESASYVTELTMLAMLREETGGTSTG